MQVLNKVDLLRGPEVERLQAWLLDSSGASAVIPTSATQARRHATSPCCRTLLIPHLTSCAHQILAAHNKHGVERSTLMSAQGRGIEDVRDWAASQLPLGPRLYPKVSSFKGPILRT